MGRSQLKYRPTRGRGQGDSSRGGRGGGSENAERSRGGRGGRGGGSRGRALESNAFRYEERQDEEVDIAVDNTVTTPGNRQFFSDERQYRDMGDVKESYFRTKAMQQWDADDDEGDDITGSVGIMDFAWIAEQLASVAPSLRFQIDPKYCVDLIDEESEEAAASRENDEQITPEAITISTQRTQDATSASAAGSALDELLAVSSSASAVATSAQQSSSPASDVSASIGTVQSTPEPAELEDLEDWLDDVLDM